MPRSPRTSPHLRAGRVAALAGGLLLSATLGAQVVAGAEAVAAKHSITLVATKDSATLGAYLVSTRGFTLYTFALDTPTKSACTGACAAQWPPVLVPKGVKLSALVHGVMDSRLGKIERARGKFQLTYEGKPLYRFAGDKAPGQMAGQGFDNVWFVALVTPATAVPPSTPPATVGAGASGTNSSGASPTSPPPTSPPPTSPPPTSPPPTSPPPTSPPPTSPPPTSPPPTSPPPTSPPPTSPPPTQPPGGGYGY